MKTINLIEPRGWHELDDKGLSSYFVWETCEARDAKRKK